MTFTDDDLRQLKTELRPGGDMYEIEPDKMLALVARMEAAEKVIRTSNAYEDFDCPHLPEDQCKCGLTHRDLRREYIGAALAWEEAAGKP